MSPRRIWAFLSHFQGIGRRRAGEDLEIPVSDRLSPGYDGSVHTVLYNESLDLTRYDEVIDVRSPSEFAEDHMPGAINLPVLTDDERVRVGTLHREQVFEARRVGAGLITTNISTMLRDGHLAGKSKGYSAIVYCWRGGQRSQSLATIMAAVGWHVGLVDGGYKAYRAHVREALAKKASELKFHVVAGLTGSGKTRILRQMETGGHPVLDLEALANHRGSLLGNEIDSPQPSQKRFESLILETLQRFEEGTTVFVESESKRVGKLACPESLWARMLDAEVSGVRVPASVRAEGLLEDYAHFVSDQSLLEEKWPVFRRLHGEAQVSTWRAMVDTGKWQAFVESLLEVHYDPSYLRCRNFREPQQEIELGALDEAGCAEAIEQLLRPRAAAVVS